MTYLHHVTLDTAHVHRAALAETPPEIRAVMTPVIRAAIEGQRPEIPGLPGYTLSIQASGRAAMSATLHRGGLDVVTFAVCRKSRAGPGAWAAIVQGDLKTVSSANPPPAPWLAVRFEAGIVLASPDETAMLANVEEVVAVTWLELRDDA